MTEAETTTPWAEHLQWCKDRALAYVDRGELANAVASMASDLTKHPGGPRVVNGPLMMLAMMHLQAGDTEEIRRWITGWN